MFKKIEGIYNVAKTIAKTLKGNKTSNTIKSVKPGQNLAKKRRIQDERTKTTSQIVDGLSDEGKRNVRTKNPLAKFNKKIADIYDKKAKGGRVGLKAGTNPFKKKSNVQKIKETFGPKKRVNAKGGKLIGGQKNIDVAAPFGTINKKDFAKLRDKKTKKKVI